MLDSCFISLLGRILGGLSRVLIGKYKMMNLNKLRIISECYANTADTQA